MLGSQGEIIRYLNWIDTSPKLSKIDARLYTSFLFLYFTTCGGVYSTAHISMSAGMLRINRGSTSVSFKMIYIDLLFWNELNCIPPKKTNQNDED
ncbi:hypothetical protein PV328_009046 [Microctonus aethiopoides]|uniref:Uncharacterized protein n=1 Tax=Microctonus aethiopoides TaxID=144406 RepID=A0AA39FKI9_9HYME|nr:hypothetical protein PV328_009046 [Microctonus aethiopoides]